MLVRKWKHQWLPLCLARSARAIRIVGVVHKSNDVKSKLACILEASESTRPRVGESLPIHHDDHIAGKGDDSAPIECLCYKSENGCRFGEKCSYAHRQVEEQPSKRLKKW